MVFFVIHTLIINSSPKLLVPFHLYLQNEELTNIKCLEY